jgi:hypothetical protein
MSEPEKKLKPNLSTSAPLSTQIKAILLIVTVVGGLGMAFGAVGLGLYLGTPPVTNNNNTTNNYYQYTYNTTYIYNNATGQRSIYYCARFEIAKTLNAFERYYFFNLSLPYRTTIDAGWIKSESVDTLDSVTIGTNLSIADESNEFYDYRFRRSLDPAQPLWYPIAGFGWLPNGTDYTLQFYLMHEDISTSIAVEIVLGYTVNL